MPNINQNNSIHASKNTQSQSTQLTPMSMVINYIQSLDKLSPQQQNFIYFFATLHNIDNKNIKDNYHVLQRITTITQNKEFSQICNNSEQYEILNEILSIMLNMEKDIKLSSVKNNTHQEVNNQNVVDMVKIMDQLGYKIDEDGCCYGIAFMAAQSCVRQGGNQHMQRSCYLNQFEEVCDLMSNLNDSDNKAYSELLEKEFPKVFYGDNENFSGIKAYIDGVYLAQKTDIPKEFAKAINMHVIQSIEFPATILSYATNNDAISTATETLTIKDKFAATLLQDTNESADKALKAYIHAIHTANPNKPFSVFIDCASEHTACIGYDGNKWLYVDHDYNLYTDNLNDIPFKEEVEDLLHSNGSLVGALTILGGSNSELKTDLKEKKMLQEIPEINIENAEQIVSFLSYSMENHNNEFVDNLVNAILNSKLSDDPLEEQEFKLQLLVGINNDNPCIMSIGLLFRNLFQ